MPTIESATQAPASVPPTHAARMILFLTVFIDLLGFGIVIPFLPMFAHDLGIGAAGIGVILAAYSVAQLLCAPVLGRISDRVGRRPVIMLGLIGSSAGYVIYGFAGSFVVLLISRLVHGACAATVPTAQAYIADTTAQRDRARGMGMIGAAFGLGFVLGPAIGGLLGHSGLRVPVFFAAALTMANFLFAAIRLPESHRPEPGARIRLAAAVAPLLALPGELLGNRLARLFGLAFMITLALSGLEATLALMLPAVYGYGALGVGLLIAYTGFMQALAQGWLLGRLVNRAGEMLLIRLGLLALALGMLPLGSWRSHAGVFAMLALLSIGYGLASPSVASLISRRSASHEQGQVLGVNQSALSMARIFGPLAGGVVYQLIGPAAPYVGGAIVALAALALSAGIDVGGA
jgi:DHA1 family tetracycline resistance protein-like MFS transporter